MYLNTKFFTLISAQLKAFALQPNTARNRYGTVPHRERIWSQTIMRTAHVCRFIVVSIHVTAWKTVRLCSHVELQICETKDIEIKPLERWLWVQSDPSRSLWSEFLPLKKDLTFAFMPPLTMANFPSEGSPLGNWIPFLTFHMLTKQRETPFEITF